MPRRLLAALAALLAAGPAWADALHAEARLRDGRVTVAVFDAANAPAPGAAVHVRDRAGRTVAEGRTDGRGEWAFPCPPAGKYELTADAGGGRRTWAAVTIPTEAALHGISPRPDEVIVTGGPSREELTHLPWLRTALALAAAGVLALVLALAARRRGPRPAASP